MKKIHYFLLILVAVLASNCDTNDDGFYKNVFIEVPNLVTIETQPNYAVGDFLYLNASFPKILNDGALIDIYQSTGGAPSFDFSYIIERKVNATDWEVVTINSNQLDINKGEALYTPLYILGICEYNEVTISYEFNVGFPLLTAGQYRLSYGYNSDSKNSVELRSASSNTNLILNINSLTGNLDANGYYNFTVN
jgi:hypothetical protein